MKKIRNIERLKGPSLFLLRLGIVLIFLYHGIPKATDWAMSQEKFAAMGFPGFLGPIVGITEVLASILLLFGAWTTLSSLALLVITSVALIGLQIPGAQAAGMFLTAGLEREILILISTLILIGHGPGSASIEKKQALT